MKIKGLLLIVMSILLMNACQQPTIDVEAEKTAIIKAINDETQAYLDYDYEKLISFFVMDSLNFRLSSGPDNYVFMQGWDQIEAFYKEELSQGDQTQAANLHVNVSKDDFRIKLYENTAYVICMETWTYTTDEKVLEIDSRQVRFMEKVDGEWKIAFLSFIGTSGYEEDEGLEELGVEFNTVL